MTLDEIRREAQQVANIKELAVKQLGFIAINGFVEQEKPYTYLDGNVARSKRLTHHRCNSTYFRTNQDLWILQKQHKSRSF